MCEQCIELQRRIDQCNRLMNPALDPLTIERMTATVSELGRQKSQMHFRHPKGHLSRPFGQHREILFCKIVFSTKLRCDPDDSGKTVGIILVVDRAGECIPASVHADDPDRDIATTHLSGADLR